MTTFDTLLVVFIAVLSLKALLLALFEKQQRRALAKAKEADRIAFRHRIESLWAEIGIQPSGYLAEKREPAPNNITSTKSRNKSHGKPKGHGPKRKRGGR